MPVDAACDRHQRTLLRIGNAGLVATVDQPVRGEEEQIDDPRILGVLAPKQRSEKLGELWAHSAERGDGGEEWIKKLGTHDGSKMPRYLPVWQADICRSLLYRSAKTWKDADMTGLVKSSADLDPRRRRILFRCWHRGIREMDLMLGQFCEAEIEGLTEAELDELERIMAEEDNDLVRYITGAEAVPAHLQTPLFERIAALRPDFSPVTGEENAAK